MFDATFLPIPPDLGGELVQKLICSKKPNMGQCISKSDKRNTCDPSWNLADDLYNWHKVGEWKEYLLAELDGKWTFLNNYNIFHNQKRRLKCKTLSTEMAKNCVKQSCLVLLPCTSNDGFSEIKIFRVSLDNDMFQGPRGGIALNSTGSSATTRK